MRLQRLQAVSSDAGIPGGKKKITGAYVKAASSGCLADSNQI